MYNSAMGNLGYIVKAARDRKGWSQRDLAAKSGVTSGTISNIERDEYYQPTIETLINITRSLDIGLHDALRAAGVNIEEAREEMAGVYKFTKHEILPGPRYPLVSLPVYEDASCGPGFLTNEYPSDFRPTPYEIVRHDLENYFYVRIKGESMKDIGIMNSSLVLVHRQDNVDPGDIAALYVGDSGVVVKEVQYTDDKVVLISHNSTDKVWILPKEDVRICGRVEEAITRFV